jgi:Domain of unknown function (DUF3854)
MAEHEQLLPQHAALLAASAVSPAVAQARGYWSVTVKVDLRRLGFSEPQARVPALLIPIWSVHGEIATYQIRADEPRIVAGKPVKYETPRGSRMVLDVPPSCREQLRDSRVPLFVTEAPRKADAAASLGLCCIAVIGVWNWRGTNEVGGKTALADWESIALNERLVYIVFDSDVMTKVGVNQALARLKAFLEGRHARVQLIYLPAGPGGAKVGLDDYLAAGNTVDDLLALATPDLWPAPAATRSAEADWAGRSQVARLVGLAEGVELFHTPAGEPFATIEVDGHHETYAVRTAAFRAWLRRRLWETSGGPATATALNDAVETLAARAEFGGATHPVAIRLDQHGDSLYLDLGTDTWAAVEIRPEGWRVVAEAPVRFRRSPTMAALPIPVGGGSLKLLRPFVNVDDEGWHLFVGALVAAFRPCGPYFALVLHGEQGSAKSTTARVSRALVDPSHSPLRGEPGEADDLLIAARNNWLVAFDNLSHLRPWLSDALCRLSTGGGLGKRQLYTDADEIVLDAQRPVILTGITELATRGDLLDRAIVIEQPTIADTERRSEAEFWAAFEAVRPQILGELLDAVAGSLANEHAVRLDRLPRMADPARWVTAAEPALGWAPGTFLAAYARNRHEGNALVLEASLLAGPLRELAGRGDWQGPAAGLLAALAEIAGPDVTRERAWPRNAAALTAALKRLAPSLRAMGLDWQRLKRSGTSRPHSIRKTDGAAVIPSPVVEDDALRSPQPTDRHEDGPTVTPDRARRDGDDGRDGAAATLFGSDRAIWSATPATAPTDDESTLWTA